MILYILIFAAGVFLGLLIAALLRANDIDEQETVYYRDKHGTLLRDDGKYIQQYDPESGEWITLN